MSDHDPRRSANRVTARPEGRRGDDVPEESARALGEALRIAGLGRWELDLGSGRLWWSEGIFDLFEVDPHSFQPSYDAFLRFVHPDDRGAVDRAYQQSVQDGAPCETVHRLLLADGRVKWAREIGRTDYDDGGRPVRSVGTVQDVTVLKQAEEALRQERDRAQRYLDAVQTTIVALDRGGRIAMINRAGCQLLGWDERELVGRNWFETCLPQPEGATAVFEVFRRIMAGDLEGVEYHDNPVVCRDGRQRLIAWHNVSFTDPDGRITGVLSSGEDVTARRRAERELADEVARRRALLDHSRDGIVVIDEEHRVIEANRRFAEMLGRTPVEVLGLYTWDFETMMSEAQVREGFADVAATNRTFETVHRRKDGSTCDVEVSASGTCWAGRRLVLCVCRDITDRKRAEAERERLRAQLLQAQKMESVGRLAGGVAHDFNNMLQTMLGNVELALEEAPPGSGLRESLDEIRRAAEHSATLTRQLLAFARKQTVAPRVLDLNDTLAGMLKMLHRLIGEEIELAWVPGARLWPVKIDPAQVDQVLANLVVNARDAIAGVGRVTIETANVSVADRDGDRADRTDIVPGDYVRLAVGDTGPGMSPEVLDHLFEPFYTTKGVGQGTGLGLATVYGIVRQNNGFIDVASEPGAGTRFTIFLPRHGGDDRTWPAQGGQGGETAGGVVPGGTETLLLVEDEPMVLRLASSMLARLGYRVLPASTPGEAIRLAEQHAGRIDLLVTDVVMPEMNGRELSRRIQDLSPAMRVLYTSGYPADVVAHRGILDEGVAFLRKPFTRKELAASVRRVIEG